MLKFPSSIGCLITHVNDDASLSCRVRQVSSWLPPLHLLVHYYPKNIQQLERIRHQNSKKKHSVKMQFHKVTYRKQTIKLVYRMTLSAYIADGTNCMLTKNCPLPTPFQNAPSKNCPLPTPFQNAPSKNSKFSIFYSWNRIKRKTFHNLRGNLRQSSWCSAGVLVLLPLQVWNGKSNLFPSNLTHRAQLLQIATNYISLRSCFLSYPWIGAGAPSASPPGP